jgi:RNA polymerase sigma-70 factor, ECF subfamily
MCDWSDGELLRHTTAGDEEAFNTLYDRHQGGIYRFVLHSSGGDALLAEEVTQEVFLVLIHEPGRYDPARGSLAAYLFGVARNLVRQHWKRNQSLMPLPDPDTEEMAPALISEPDVLGEITSQERLEALHRAILALPLHYREAVVLCHLEGLGYAEAAGVLGCSEGTVCSRLSRARALLIGKLRGCGTCLSGTKTSAS